MRQARHVIIGGGMVAGYAAKEFVEKGGGSGELTIISREKGFPYERPPLSKGFLLGKDTEDALLINPEAWYSEHGIEVLRGSEVTDLDANARTMRVGGGDLSFESLLIATGAGVRVFKVPGADLSGIFYLRSLADAKRLRDAAIAGKRAVVAGGGFIGMEVAAALAQRGVETTLVIRDNRIWSSFLTPEMSRFFEAYYEARGVKFIRAVRVNEVRGYSSISSVSLDDGREVHCDLLVGGIGVAPCTAVAAGSGLDVDNGILVNEFLETDVPGVYAAGDVANYNDLLTGKRRRLEHWDNAVSQGRHAMANMMGAHEPYLHVPYFFSDVFDLSYEFWGDPSGADNVVHRGDMSTPSFSVWWLKDSRVVAAFVMARPDEERETAPEWIRNKQTVSAERLKADVRPVREAAEAGQQATTV